MRTNLQAGKTYCVRFYTNIANTSPRGMDGFGAYFGDNTIDTITKCTIPLSYINPQVKNPVGHVISDTLNWVPITGTFVANGTEKYAVLGNFLADNAVTTASINTPSYPQNWTDVLIDDVSCIDIDLPAYAGPDQAVLSGDSVYIGRERDFAIDEACLWYQLPNTTTPIDTAAGLWVSPAVTTTYVVKQQLYCSSVKYDTVVVYRTAVGISELKLLNNRLILSPNPAQDELRLQGLTGFENTFNRVFIYNNLGQLIREEEISLKNGAAVITTGELPEGAYQLKISSKEQEGKSLIKKLLIAK